MRFVFVFAILAAACAEEVSPPDAPPPVATAQGRAPSARPRVRTPRNDPANYVAGVVTKRSDLYEAMIESGGPNPFPLRLDTHTEVTVDGQPGSAFDIREGQLVRAAYKRNADGEPVAILVVANSKPVTR
jgi:hypothetical protein